MADSAPRTRAVPHSAISGVHSRAEVMRGHAAYSASGPAWCSCPAAGCCISKHLGLQPAEASGRLDEMESAHPA